MKAIFTFWLSLAFTNFFMALELPICTAFISTMPDAKTNLAAYGVIVGLGLFLQAPILRIISLPLLFLKNSESYIIIRNFSFAISGAMSLFLVMCSTERGFDYLLSPILALSPDISFKVRDGLYLWAAGTFCVGIRRFYNGLLLKFHRPSKITTATVVRMMFLVLSITVMPNVSSFSPIQAALYSVICGVLFEMFCSMYFARDLFKKCTQLQENGVPVTYQSISKVYLPLSTSSIVAMGNGPLISALAARGPRAVESLAVIPVILGYLQPITWSMFAVQDTTHALVNKDVSNIQRLNHFSMLLGLIFSFLLLSSYLFGATDYYFISVNQLNSELFNLTRNPIIVSMIFPLMMSMRNYYKALVINHKQTGRLIASEVVETASIFFVFCFGLNFSQSSSVDIIFFSLLISQICVVLTLLRFTEEIRSKT